MSAAEGDGDPCSALLPAALLGCERQIPAPPAWPGAAGRLAAAIADGEGKQATRLLRLAGTIAVCANAS